MRATRAATIRGPIRKYRRHAQNPVRQDLGRPSRRPPRRRPRPDLHRPSRAARAARAARLRDAGEAGPPACRARTSPSRCRITPSPPSPAATDETNPIRRGVPARHARGQPPSNGIRVFDIDDPEQGISHVVAPELGMVLPGATHAVPDSHACDGRRARRARLRLRHHRARAHPGDAGDRDEAAEAHAHPARRHARPARHRQGRGAAHHRRARRRRRARPRGRICRRRPCARCRSKAA